MWESSYKRLLEKKGVSYELQSSFSRQETEHDEINEDAWEARENEWLPYVKIDALSIVFRYARYMMGMEGLTGFSKKNSLILPSLLKKYFNSLRNENDEPIYTYTDPFMRNFVRQSMKGGRCNAFNQYLTLEFQMKCLIFFQKK